MAIPALFSRRLPQGLYARAISKGLNDAYAAAYERAPIDVRSLRAVVFSDHHRGRGDGADDFARCEGAYAAALGWYLEQGYELWLLGDVEELWEDRPGRVLKHYEAILELESEFGDRLLRFYGNHDMAWQRTANVEAHLAGYLPGTAVHEAMKVTIVDGGRPLVRLFMVHGHQGTIDSGNFLVLPFSRFVVRFGWGTLQRWRKFANTSPATDAVLRSKHDRAMAAWADRHPERIVLIAGHTHHPVFANTKPPDRKAEAAKEEEAYRAALAAGKGVARARAARELAAMRARREQEHDPIHLERPSYYNTGCCSFGDGDVTGLELADGEIRLVRWLNDAGRPEPERLERVSVRDTVNCLTGATPSHG